MPSYDRKILKEYQTQFEGRRKFPYDDKTGREPIVSLPDGRHGGKITIGVGWNLTDNGLPDEIIDRLHDIALDRVDRELFELYPWMLSLDPVRQMVVVDMAFNMGVPVFSGFVNTIGMIRTRAYQAASRGMLNSRWAEQVGSRARILSVMMRDGKLPEKI